MLLFTHNQLLAVSPLMWLLSFYTQSVSGHKSSAFILACVSEVSVHVLNGFMLQVGLLTEMRSKQLLPS